jgi:haloacid dehalogenase superfamily, subfamily IA, variant 3 with third motif having DD or ED/haloacid dehalogenase superfamily, subfamily IA, variant 1 with third motif having Dx(3-4)D or Dx(3-4)E
MVLSAKGLIFDYGGTIDTNGIHWSEVIWDEYVAAGIPITREKFRDAYVYVERTLGSKPIIMPCHTFREVLDIKISMQFEKLELTDDAKRIVVACYEKTTDIINSAKETLDVLAVRYPMILVSNFYGNIRTVLDEFCLTKYFRKIIESAEVGIRKPDPAIYKLAINKFGFEPKEVVIIGDSYKNDIAPANILGCRSIWLKGKGWDDKDEEINHPFIIRDFAELKSLPLGEI